MAMNDGTFTIKEAALRAGVSADTIRHYERVGVVRPAPRTDAGYRRYSESALAEIAIVRSALQFGFTLKELALFFESREKGRPPCASVRAAGGRLLQEMDRQLAELTQARAAMATLLAEWDARLARTPAGAPAHLLSTLPATARSARPRPRLPR
jgi:MerR family transcriptional regulator, Zn(II)-responsive regulator of zntA